MDWLTQLASSAHAVYVAAAFGLAFALLGIEILLLRRRWQAASGARP